MATKLRGQGRSQLGNEGKPRFLPFLPDIFGVYVFVAPFLFRQGSGFRLQSNDGRAIANLYHFLFGKR